MKFIYLAGYQHCGTSILRRIVGSHPDVFETVNEVRPEAIQKATLKKIEDLGFSTVVCKSALTHLPQEGRGRLESEGDVRINIIKNPLDVMGSLYRRWLEKFDLRGRKYAPVKHWRRWAKYMLDEAPDRDANFRYEDLFTPDGNPDRLMIDAIFEHCGLDPVFDIVDRVNSSERPINFGEVPKSQPKCHEHEAFRSWEINQPLKFMGGRNHDQLDPEEVEEITSHRLYQRLYGTTPPVSPWKATSVVTDLESELVPD